MARQSALEKYHVDLKDVGKSQAWFDNKVKSFDHRLVSPARIMADGGDTFTSNPKPGSLYSFFYMPKGAETLPHYDTFPLVFPFSKTAETFFGLNMHYLPYPMRFALFRALMQVSGVKGITDDKKMLFQWDTIKGIAKLAPAQACVKQYRFDHLKSPFIYIKPTEWATAMTMPLHRFSGQTAPAIWQESKLKRSW